MVAGKRIARTLTGGRWFLPLLVGLLVLSALFVVRFRGDFAVLAQHALGREAAQAEPWQRWANHYGDLFAMLPWGERVGIQVEGARSSGILLTRTADGMVAESRLFLRRAEPGVVLTMSRETAGELLATVPATEPDAIWQMMKDRLYGRQLTLWSDPDLTRLHEGGYLAFMRAIDTRPPDVPWTAVEALLQQGAP